MEEEKIKSFMSLTGCSKEKAKAYLQSSNFDTSVALNKFNKEQNVYAGGSSSGMQLQMPTANSSDPQEMIESLLKKAAEGGSSPINEKDFLLPFFFGFVSILFCKSCKSF
jgi:hypothetical protein